MFFISLAAPSLQHRLSSRCCHAGFVVLCYMWDPKFPFRYWIVILCIAADLNQWDQLQSIRIVRLKLVNSIQITFNFIQLSSSNIIVLCRLSVESTPVKCSAFSTTHKEWPASEKDLMRWVGLCSEQCNAVGWLVKTASNHVRWHQVKVKLRVKDRCGNWRCNRWVMKELGHTVYWTAIELSCAMRSNCQTKGET